MRVIDEDLLDEEGIYEDDDTMDDADFSNAEFLDTNESQLFYIGEEVNYNGMQAYISDIRPDGRYLVHIDELDEDIELTEEELLEQEGDEDDFDDDEMKDVEEYR